MSPDDVMQLDPSMMMHDSGAVPPSSETSGLVTPESAAAAAMFVNNLVRTLAADRSMQVHSGGPTIEAVVREEVRPMLKQWLDNNLSPLVERAVRLEIERVVGRVGS